MADIQRTAEAVWTGTLREGKGRVTSGSGLLKGTPYSFGTRFEDEPGTNPEELIAAAHAACYNMAFASALGKKGYQPERLETRAICSMSRQEPGGVRITKMRLETRGQVPSIDEATFKEIAQEAEKRCPVSNALRGGLEIELEAALM
jgi:osmotically inducible protein OsmC